MSSSQMPVGQGFAAHGEALEQPRGPAVLVAGANGLVVRPSLLLGTRAEFRLGERVAQGLSRAIGWMVPRTWRPVSAESVAAALVTAARVDAPGARVLENAALLAAEDERPVG